MSMNKRMSVIAAATVAVLTGCQSSLRCDAGAVERNGMCLGSCNTNSPPCVQADGGVLESDGGASDGAMDASDGAVDSGPVCEAGASVCSGACVDIQSSTAHCGRCGMACSEGPGERASCSSGQCQSACVTGFERVGMACEALVPRLIGPMSTSYVSSQRPTLRWSAPMGVDGAQVEVCSSRDCATIEQSATVGSGATSWRVERALSAGVHYWRVRGRVGSVMGTRASAGWEFVVGARDRATDTQWGTLMDVNGDGFGDVVAGDSGQATSAWGGAWFVYLGSAMGPADMATVSVVDPQSSVGGDASVASAGDINGDGYGDAVLGAANGLNAMRVATGSVTVLLGSAAGGSVSAAQLFGEAAGDWFGASVAAVGDINGDGYGDIAVGAPHASAPASEAGKVYVFLGSAAGVAPTPALVLSGTRPMGHFGLALTGAHDVNGDRLPELLVAAPNEDDPSEGELNVGRVSLYAGTSAGFSATPVRSWTRVERAGEVAGGYMLGASLARPGDVDGDGFGDLVFGSADSRIKREVIFARGAMGGVGVMFDRVSVTPADAASVGESVDLGDATGDGFDDVLLSYRALEGGGVTLRAGSSTGVSSVQQLVAVTGSRRAGLLGDVNADGRSDAFYAAAATMAHPPPQRSYVYLVAGSATNSWTQTWGVRGYWAR